MENQVKAFCWSAITLDGDGALTGGYCDTAEECEAIKASQKWTWFAYGPTPEDLLRP